MQELMASGDPAYSFTLIDSAGNSRPLNLVDGVVTAPAEEGKFKLYASYTEYGTTYYSNGVDFTVKKPDPYWFYFGDTKTLVLKSGPDVPAGYGATVTGSGKIPDKIDVSSTGSGWEAYRPEMVKAVVADEITAPEDMSHWFFDAENLASLEGFEKLDTSRVTSLYNTFDNCESLKDVSALADWDTSNVTNMQSVFNVCTTLESLSGLENWNTGSVTNMVQMFFRCSSLNDISALADWDTSNVTSMDLLFYACPKVTNWTALNEWDVSKATSHSWAFGSCNGSLPSWADASWQ